MKILNTEIEYFIDYLDNKIHILDKSKSYYNDLPNSIGPEFQKELIEKDHLLLDIISFEWVCYCAGGFVLVYNSRTLRIISATEKWLHRPYMDAIIKK